MGSSGKVVNLVVGKEVTSISGQFQKTYIGTPTAKLSLTLEEGSKLSSVGENAFKDNTFFVSIDLSNAGQNMSMGENAFNGVSNLTVFKTGTGKLTLANNALANLKNCKEFYHLCSSIDISTSHGFDVVFMNPTNAWTGSATANIASMTYNPYMSWTGWSGWYNIKGSGSYYLSYAVYNNGVQKMNLSGGTATLTGVTSAYNPTYAVQNYKHTLLNLGANVGCSVILGEKTTSVTANLFSSGVRCTIDSGDSPSVTTSTASYTASVPSTAITYVSCYNNNSEINSGKVTVPAETRALTAAAVTVPTATAAQDIISAASGIKVVEVITETGINLSVVGEGAFGLDDRAYTSTATLTTPVPANQTLTGKLSSTTFRGYRGNGNNVSSYFTGWGPASTIQSGQGITVTSKATTISATTTVALTNSRKTNTADTTTQMQHSNLKKVVLLTTSDACAIKYGAFGFNPDLQKIVIGSGINNIEADTFFQVNASSVAYILGKASNTFKPDSNNGLTSGGHSSIGTITYLEGAKDLGEYIAHYQIGASVTAYLFKQLDGTYVINIVGSGATYDTYTASNLPEWHATYGTKVSKVIVDDTVTSVGPYLFYGHTALTTVQFGTGLKSIGAHAFGNCTGLDSFTVPATLTSVGERILEGAAVKTVYYNANTEDAYHSMSGCDAKEIILGANVTKIGDGTLGDISFSSLRPAKL